MFIRKTSNGPSSFIALHVDDGIIAASTKQALDEVLSVLADKFKVKSDYHATRYLKLNLIKHGKFYYLDQQDYIAKVAQRFQLVNAKPVSTPMEKGFQSRLQDGDKPLPPQTPYRELMGALSLLAETLECC